MAHFKTPLQAKILRVLFQPRAQVPCGESCPPHPRPCAQSRTPGPPCPFTCLHASSRRLHPEASLARGSGQGPSQAPLLSSPRQRRGFTDTFLHCESVLRTFPLLAPPPHPLHPFPANYTGGPPLALCCSLGENGILFLFCLLLYHSK